MDSKKENYLLNQIENKKNLNKQEIANLNLELEKLSENEENNLIKKLALREICREIESGELQKKISKELKAETPRIIRRLILKNTNPIIRFLFS